MNGSLVTAHSAVEPMHTEALTPMALMQLAIEKGAGVGELERLVALQERYEANQAKKMYVLLNWPLACRVSTTAFTISSTASSDCRRLR